MKLIFGRADSPDIYYRTGWNSDVEVLYKEDEEKVLYVPGFEYLRAKEETSGVRVEQLKDPVELLKSFEGKIQIPNRFPHKLALELKEAECVKEMWPEHKIKSEEEISLIADAQEGARKAIKLVTEMLKSCEVKDGILMDDDKPMTSEKLKLLARNSLMARRMDCPDMIISSGEQTAKPHNRGSGEIKEGPVIIDIFPKASSMYHGDMTRTVIVGRDEKAEKMIVAVKEVQELCIKKCVPGAKVADIHNFAVEELAKRGFSTEDEKGLIHSLGHGLGLDIHESPSLGPNSEEVLEEGMVITIEPGLYYDIGVRWEDVVVVGEEPRVL